MPPDEPKSPSRLMFGTKEVMTLLIITGGIAMTWGAMTFRANAQDKIIEKTDIRISKVEDEQQEINLGMNDLRNDVENIAEDVSEIRTVTTKQQDLYMAQQKMLGEILVEVRKN